MKEPNKITKPQKKKKEFSFYAAPLSIIHILGLLVLAFLIDHFINSSLESSRYFSRYESALPYVICGLIIVCLLRKRRVEIVDNHTINFYTRGKLKYTNTIDNLLYIRCAGQGKITSSIVFVFSDKRIRLCMPLVMFSQYFKLYELEKLSSYLRTQFKLKQREHRTIFGVSKYVFTYWNPEKDENYKVYSESKGRRVC
ncbi:hypothetical protein [Prevotella aurantiaca]|uniref:hypothetical protein n=1 Tax=Prevotella aurantiaca TaxID=596085 RepID=UPI0028DB3904|nr:hypothetical protein [Prevotella aurantiaca]